MVARKMTLEGGRHWREKGGPDNVMSRSGWLGTARWASRWSTEMSFGWITHAQLFAGALYLCHSSSRGSRLAASHRRKNVSECAGAQPLSGVFTSALVVTPPYQLDRCSRTVSR